MAKFWKRRPDAEPAEHETSAQPSEEQKVPGEAIMSAKACGSELEQLALDHLAELLRLWGKNAFDVEGIDAATIGVQMERWARHVLMGPETQPADQAADSEAESATAIEPQTTIETGHDGANTEPQLESSRQRSERRDWNGMRTFVTEIRQREKTHVRRQLASTKKMIGEFVQTIGSVMSDDQGDQSQIMSAVTRLRHSIEGQVTIEELSREAMNAIQVITSVSQKRTQRQKTMLQELTQNLKKMRNELDNAHREMELDGLTRLFNRKAFDVQIERVFELSRLTGQEAVLMMVDVDHFKAVNDTYGHPFGDEVLRYLAKCCVKSFPRKSDFVSRYGGEEIAIVLQDTDGDTGMELGTRLIESVRLLGIPHETEGMVDITISIGMATMNPKETPMQWLESADRALYAAKQAGRDRIVRAKGG